MYKRGNARPLDDSMLRLGTLKASCLMSSPELASDWIRLLSTTETETGTSRTFSSRWVAVTTTSASESDSAVDASSAASAIRIGRLDSSEKTNARQTSLERCIVVLPFVHSRRHRPPAGRM